LREKYLISKIARTAKQNSILVVDDDPSVLDSISLLLKKYGYIVISCERAKDAFKAFQEEKIDAVLSDVKMPEISGVELLEKIHAYKFPFDPSLPQIVNKYGRP